MSRAEIEGRSEEMAELFSDYLTYKLLFGAGGGGAGRRPPSLVAAAALASAATEGQFLSSPLLSAKRAFALAMRQLRSD